MSKTNAFDYDGQVRAIRASNQPLLDAFEIWLEQASLSQKTIKTHVSNISFFTNYLVYYEPLRKLDEATESDVWMFLADWFPRKALWASVTSVKSYLASFKTFFLWMGETGHASPQVVADVIETLKVERGVLLRNIAEQ
jgi:site-specific recombinase XerD